MIINFENGPTQEKGILTYGVSYGPRRVNTGLQIQFVRFIEYNPLISKQGYIA